jgi:uracil-DNA glycosylase family 4
MLVGEAWGAAEAAAKSPFCGGSGQELNRLLAEAGFARDAILCTNVVPARPSGNEMWRFFEPHKGNPNPALRGLHPGPEVHSGLRSLYAQILSSKPKLIIAVGNYALWALTNCTKYSVPADAEGRRCPSGIESWRGSMWYADASPLPETKLLPIIHPAAIMREWYKRPVTKHDLKERIPQALADDWRGPEPLVLAPPSFEQCTAMLRAWISRANSLPLRLVCDIETARGLMTCIGFAPSASLAMTIPFIRLDGKGFASYWNEDEELTISSLLRKLLSHPNVQIEGQNFLYDTQYIYAFLACIPRLAFDTMLAHHLLFPGTPKGLDYLSSLYCRYHWYWKEDGKEWDIRGDLESHLRYNALDCLRTFEVATILRQLIRDMDQLPQWREECQKNSLALRMMLRGVRIDQTRRSTLALQLATAREQYASWFERMLPQSLSETNSDTKWYDSPFQQKEIFSEQFGLRLPLHRKTGQPTFGKEALGTLSARHPEFVRLFDALRDYRSLGVFYNTFVKAPLDPDGRMRCMFNTSGTETFRWSSSSNAFGRGTNLQNIPAGNEE